MSYLRLLLPNITWQVLRPPLRHLRSRAAHALVLEAVFTPRKLSLNSSYSDASLYCCCPCSNVQMLLPVVATSRSINRCATTLGWHGSLHDDSIVSDCHLLLKSPVLQPYAERLHLVTLDALGSAHNGRCIPVSAWQFDGRLFDESREGNLY